MTLEDWVDVVDEALGLWGSDAAVESPVFKRRIQLWTDRFRQVRLDQFRAALGILERSCPRWPSLSDVYSALDRVQAREKALASREAAEKPMTPSEWASIACQLRLHAQHPARSPDWRNYFESLAKLYAENADRATGGEEIIWHPPRIPLAGIGASLGRTPAAPLGDVLPPLEAQNPTGSDW